MKVGVFESRVLKRIFASRRGKTVGDLRKLLNEELHNSTSRRM
jgi:hypothetical protein